MTPEHLYNLYKNQMAIHRPNEPIKEWKELTPTSRAVWDELLLILQK